jgi:hypothetical protein
VVGACGGSTPGERTKEGKRQGRGAYAWRNGVAYSGEWRDDKMEGPGVMRYADGTVCEGTWRNNRQHGKGKIVWPRYVQACPSLLQSSSPPPLVFCGTHPPLVAHHNNTTQRGFVRGGLGRRQAHRPRRLPVCPLFPNQG